MPWRIARLFRAKLSVGHVVELPLTPPVDARAVLGADSAKEMLDGAEEIANAGRIRAEAGPLQARNAGRAIVEEAAAGEVDLMFMEGQQRTRPGRLHPGRECRICAGSYALLEMDFQAVHAD